MARKGQAIFQLDVKSDEEWKLLLAKPGLIVNDVYTDWCGPCSSMASTLKKTKVEVNSDYLIFTMANADKITDLRRFKGTSEPTWVFIASNQLLRVMYGCNAPILIDVILKEFQHELECMEGNASRITRPLSKLTPEEEKKKEEKRRQYMMEQEEKQKDIELRWDKVRHRYFERVARCLTSLTVMVFFPHTVEVGEDGKDVCPPSNKMMGIYDAALVSIKDQLSVQLTKETVTKMFYNCGVLFPTMLLKSLEKEPVIATRLQEYETPTDPHQRLPTILKEDAIAHLDEVEQRLANLAYGENMNPLNPSPESPCAEFMFYTPKGTAIPPFWTPVEHVSKAAAVEVLFPEIVEELKIKMEPLPPPAYVVIFEARRAREVLDTAAQFASNVMRVGFFDSEEPSEANLVCKTVYQYEKLPKIQKFGLKMVLALEKTTSDPMLIMAQMGPLYISPDEKQGIKEVETFFPPKIDEEMEPDPWGPPPEGSSVEEESLEEMESFPEEVSEELGESDEERGESILHPDEVIVEVDEGPKPSVHHED